MGQVQSRQQDESHFKLDAKDKDAVIKKYTGTTIHKLIIFVIAVLCSLTSKASPLV
jgi:hypothetical protein